MENLSQTHPTPEEQPLHYLATRLNNIAIALSISSAAEDPIDAIPGAAEEIKNAGDWLKRQLAEGTIVDPSLMGRRIWIESQQEGHSFTIKTVYENSGLALHRDTHQTGFFSITPIVIGLEMASGLTKQEGINLIDLLIEEFGSFMEFDTWTVSNSTKITRRLNAYRCFYHFSRTLNTVQNNPLYFHEQLGQFGDLFISALALISKLLDCSVADAFHEVEQFKVSEPIELDEDAGY